MNSENKIYEIKLDRIPIQISENVWHRIQQKVRRNDWFYLIWDGVKYKYKTDKTFPDRSTIFCFEKIDEDAEDEIEFIIIENGEVVQ
jgi:hypothetical protein